MLFSYIAASDTKEEIMLESTSGKETSKPVIRDAQVEKPRGQLLYETHCNSCHDNSVHGRNPRKAASIEKIEYFVKRWSTELNLKWSQSDIEAVTGYLNSRYYQYEK
jgi:mono/diheme cytochrome c family protein